MRREETDNPRYPHCKRIVRKVVEGWLAEADTDSSTDGESGDVEVVIYCGPGRSYTDTTTTGDAKVDSNKRKASIPVRFDEWGCCPASTPGTGQGPAFPMSGDILYVTKGHISEEWEVKDFEPDNDRSVVYGELNRNFNVE